MASTCKTNGMTVGLSFHMHLLGEHAQVECIAVDPQLFKQLCSYS